MSIDTKVRKNGTAAAMQRMTALMRFRYPVAILAMVLIVLVSMAPAQASTVPTFSIVSVDPDVSVTIQTYNYPANQDFVVTMGPMGTQGINGIVVGTTHSGAGGSFQATYAIPDQLKGSYQIAVRMQTQHAYPFFAYNWFYNNTSGSGGQPPPGYTGIPTFNVCAVVHGQTVTIKGHNYPPNQIFTVTMGPMGTQGVNGIVVGTLDSGAGGDLTATYNIPPEMAGWYQIAIRTQTSQASPFVAYNWFFNNTATVC